MFKIGTFLTYLHFLKSFWPHVHCAVGGIPTGNTTTIDTTTITI